MKTRYTIIEPGPIVYSKLYDMTWVDVELETVKAHAERRVPRTDPRERIALMELGRILDPLFPPDARGWERVHVNSFKGPADMFVGEMSAREGEIYKNDGATLIYWTATAMRWIAENDGEPPTYEEMQKRALRIAADALNGTGAMVRELREETPRIYGRAVLFDDEVWK